MLWQKCIFYFWKNLKNIIHGRVKMYVMRWPFCWTTFLFDLATNSINKLMGFLWARIVLLWLQIYSCFVMRGTLWCLFLMTSRLMLLMRLTLLPDIWYTKALPKSVIFPIFALTLTKALPQMVFFFSFFALILTKVLPRKHEKSFRLKPQGLRPWYLVCSIT